MGIGRNIGKALLAQAPDMAPGAAVSMLRSILGFAIDGASSLPGARQAAGKTLTKHDGDVEQAITLDWAGFQALPQREFSADLHCVTRWSKLGTLWRGVAVSVLADLVRPVADPVYVQARADGNYTANLRLVDMLSDKAFVATEFDGKPLSVEHGGPARLVVPDLYLWKSAKWLRGLHFSPYDYKGFWEKLGYHNYGDPWKEQRYRG